MNKGLIVCFLLLSQFSLKSQLRHTKGIQTFLVGMSTSLQEEGNAYQASYIHFLNRKQFLEVQFSFENLRMSEERERQYFEAIDVPGSSQDELILSPFTQKNFFLLEGYYLSFSYGHLFIDIKDKFYLHGIGGIKTGYEQLEREVPTTAVVGGVSIGPEVQVFLSPNIGISLRGSGSYLVGASQAFRLLGGGSIIIGF